MKKFFTLCLVLVGMVALVACGSQKPAEPVTFSSSNGWDITYSPDVMTLTEKDGNADLAFAGDKKTSAAYVDITYVAGKMPQEALYEKIADVDDSRVIRTEGKFGSTDAWAFTYLVSPEKEGGIREQLTGIEHNGGTLLISIGIEEGDDAKMMPASDAIEAVVNTLVFTNHEPQQQFSYVPGTYVHTYTEEMEGEDMVFTNTVVMNEDHSGTLTVQDTVPFTWTSTQLVGQDFAYEYTIEGDTLLLNEYENEWTSYTKQQAE